MEYASILDINLATDRALYVLYHPEPPECRSWSNQIYLSANNRFWCQYAYQFSHEYCHFLIFKPVCKNIRWLEETICEMASLFILPRISKTWNINPPYESWRSYAPQFSLYCQRASLENTTHNLLNNDSLLNYLAEDCYDRKINRYIANELLPLFDSNPKLWNIVFELPKVPRGLPFYDSLLYLKRNTPPDLDYGIDNIALLFFGGTLD